MSNSTPIVCPRQTVIEEWIVYNGHLNMAYYHVMFDRAVDYVYDQLGIGEAYTQAGMGSCFTLEVHVHYLSEIALGDQVEIAWQLLDRDHKRLHFFEQMTTPDGTLVATAEQMAMHIDMQTRRSAAFNADAQAKIEALYQQHRHLPHPQQVGHQIGITRAV